ncbi:hypothetical protein H6P81_016888 [Aristolochia fimbriata]|uniref:Smr domain-containing protein n=1 Tax=Aristolochia fimbriata TaxID=158543 RepID=A0AAV7DWY0_ARIFI|nr:hypothetical protein H6P81_016888 [Aristolochia fimbriata]
MEFCNCCVLSQRTPIFFHFTLHASARRFVARAVFQGNPVIVSNDLKKETEKTLEWHSICSQVSAFTSTSMGLAVSQEGNLPIGQTREESQRLLNQTTAATLLPQPLDFSGIVDISSIVNSSVLGELLTIRELCSVERTLTSSRRLLAQLEQVSLNGESSERYSPLLKILEECSFLEDLEQKIGFCIDCNLSFILDRASDNLELIRSERKRNMENLELHLKETSMKIFQSGGIDKPLITKRRSRMCVGIRASHRSLLPEGVILDVSSSGATYFMEPKEAVELNNMEVKLSNSEKDEENAILSMLTSEIAESEKEIRNLMGNILELDLASARGSHARWIKGVCPIFSQSKGEQVLKNDRLSYAIDIEGVQHPLLLESSLKSTPSVSPPEGSSTSVDSDKEAEEAKLSSVGKNKFPVPLDIKIANATKVVVISGPNTGGKTATLKTLGLASLMSKAGMYLPARKSPKLPWFDQVLADIGDHQSLEHNLSTFSGHISRLCKIMEVASEESLVLIDEIGSGTDPSEGVALSTSILHYLAGRVRLAMVTTHYADLSLLKSKDCRFENAAMEFSLETLQPTYRVLWGSTGNSNALSIAKSIGFNQKVLTRAHEWVEKLMPNQQKERRGLLYQSLIEEKNLLEAQAVKAASVLSEVKKIYAEILSESEDLDRREAALKAKEVQQVLHELKVAKMKMQGIVNDFKIQLSNSSPDQYTSLLRKAEAAISSIVSTHHASSDLGIGKSSSNRAYIPKVGDQVFVKGFGNKLAIVVEISGDDSSAVVQFGKMKVNVKKDVLRPVTKVEKSSTAGSLSRLKGQVSSGSSKQAPSMSSEEVESIYSPAVQTSKNTIDLRGMRVEEAAHHLNMALSASGPNRVLFVIHGMGSGVVKERALEILKSHSRVTRFEQESSMNYGCTVAYIK